MASPQNQVSLEALQSTLIAQGSVVGSVVDLELDVYKTWTAFVALPDSLDFLHLWNLCANSWVAAFRKVPNQVRSPVPVSDYAHSNHFSPTRTCCLAL